VPSRPQSRRPASGPRAGPILTAAWLFGLGFADVAAAQPAAPPSPVQAPTPAEAPPPVDVPPPAPLAAPAISDKDLAPAPPPRDQVVARTVATPTRRVRYDIAVIQALDKVTAENMRFEAAVGRPVRYKSLVFTVKACERAASDEAIDDSIAYVTVDSQPRPAPGKPIPPARQAFKGWMYASSPGVHPFEHPVYDAWLISCRASAPAPTLPSPPRPAAKPDAPQAPAPPSPAAIGTANKPAASAAPSSKPAIPAPPPPPEEAPLA